MVINWVHVTTFSVDYSCEILQSLSEFLHQPVQEVRSLFFAVTSILCVGLSSIQAAHIEYRSTVAQQGVQAGVKTKTWQIPDGLAAGDCRMYKGKITIKSDGTGHFDSLTLTKHSINRKVWYQTLAFYNSENGKIFEVNKHDSPGMKDGHPPPQYNFTYDFNFPASLFDQVAFVFIGCDCKEIQ